MKTTAAEYSLLNLPLEASVCVCVCVRERERETYRLAAVCTITHSVHLAASTATTVTAKLLVACVDSHTEYCSEMCVRGAGRLLLYQLEITGRLNCHCCQHREP